VTNKRKALLAAAVAALLTVPGVAMASGAFDGGDGHAATVEEVTTTIDQAAAADTSDDSVGDLAEDPATDLADDVDEAAEVEDSADGPDDQSDDHAGGVLDDGAPGSDAGTAGIHS
jgi:hypothetical protein